MQRLVVCMGLEAGRVQQLEGRIVGAAPDSQDHRTGEDHFAEGTGYKEEADSLGDHIVERVEGHMVAVEVDCMQVGALDFHNADSGDTACMMAAVDQLEGYMLGPEGRV